MISNARDLEISQLQNDIHENGKEIYRLQDETVKKIHHLKELQAKRDEESGLKVRVMDSEAQLSAIRRVEWLG